jgi:hypothetical protein
VTTARGSESTRMGASRLKPTASFRMLYPMPTLCLRHTIPPLPPTIPNPNPNPNLNPDQSLHFGISCDKSGQCPIIGWRFKLRGTDPSYDLCEAEFNKLSDAEKDRYERIAPPDQAAPQSEVRPFTRARRPPELPSGPSPARTCHILYERSQNWPCTLVASHSIKPQ